MSCAVIAHDANGNTLSDPSGKSYSWDFENRLVGGLAVIYQDVVPGEIARLMGGA